MKTLNKILKTSQSENNKTARDHEQLLIGSFTQRLLNRPSSSHYKRENKSEILDKGKVTKKRTEY